MSIFWVGSGRVGSWWGIAFQCLSRVKFLVIDDEFIFVSLHKTHIMLSFLSDVRKINDQMLLLK